MLQQGLYSPHRSYRLELIVLIELDQKDKQKNLFLTLPSFFCLQLYSFT